MFKAIKQKLYEKYPYKTVIANISEIDKISEQYEYVTVFDRENARQELHMSRPDKNQISEYAIDAELMRHKGIFDHVEYEHGRPECITRLTKIYNYRIKIEYRDKNDKKYINTLTFQDKKQYNKNDKIEICYRRDNPNEIKLPYEVNSDKDIRENLFLGGLLTLATVVAVSTVFLFSDGKWCENMNAIIFEVLKILSENKHVSLHRIKEELLKNTQIYTTENVPDVIFPKSKDEFLTVKYNVENLSPQVIDFKPIFHNGKAEFFYPVMIIPHKNEDKWQLVHEICHLFSIGEYEIYNKKIYHKFGVNNYQYTISDGKVICTQKNVYYRENEILNDAVTWHFLEKIHNSEILPPDEYTAFHCQPIKKRDDIDMIIASYFSGKYEAKTQLIKIFDKNL